MTPVGSLISVVLVQRVLSGAVLVSLAAPAGLAGTGAYAGEPDRLTVSAWRAREGFPNGYFLACSKYGLVPEAWSVTSTTRSISGTAWVIATSMPWLRVTVAMPQPWQPPPRRR